LQRRDQGLAQLEDPRELVDSSGLTPRQHDPAETIQVLRAAYRSDIGAARRQRAEMFSDITLQSKDTDERWAAHQPRWARR
jgi:hypothetical protein